MNEILDIVDLDDNVIGQNTRHDSYKNGTRNRIACVTLRSSEGKIFLQRRSEQCSFCPWYWDTAAGGHVQSGQNYEEAAYRELSEELWVVGITLSFIAKDHADRYLSDQKYQRNPKYIRQYSHEFFRAVYEWIFDGPFYFDDGEVSQIRAFSLDELQCMIDSQKEDMTPWCIDVLVKYYL